MGFRLRLALFLVAILVTVQALTWASVYAVTRRQSIAEGERQLAVAADAFVHQLDDVSARVAQSVRVLSLDYALREAIAQHDRATVLSALRNHGRRVGAARMLLVGLDGRINVDTGAPGAADEPAFPFPDLLDAAVEQPVAAVVSLEGRAYWMVVVMVSAPQPVAMIAAGIPIDDRLLAQMQDSSALPRQIELIASADGAPWQVVAHGLPHTPLAAQLPAGAPLPRAPVILTVKGEEYVALARPIDRAGGDVAIAAVIGYSLDQALGPFRAVTTTWVVLVLLGLAAGVAGALLIARGVAQPLEALAGAATRIAAGDYSRLPESPRRDELARVASAFNRMSAAIGEREAHIRFQAEHDVATGLPNRQAAEARIQADLARAPDAEGALLLVGLARLPDIVKTLGHAVGDRLVRDAGQRLRALAGDRWVARAGDSQLLLWAPATGAETALVLARAARDALAEPYRETDLSLDTAPAVGIALAPAHGELASALLQHADVALVTAHEHELPLAVYDPASDPHRPERLALMTELRAAIDGQGLSLHYQPRLRLATGIIEGVEGLVRWNHPLRGAIPPDQFVPLAERTGNVRRLTRWVLAEGIAQARAWQAAGVPLRVALNLSARDLDDEQLPPWIAARLAEHGLAPERLVLEVTESAVMAEPDTAVGVLRRLAELGIDLAIDDFGVGQSSLAYLRRLPVRELKIDQSFVRRLAQDVEDQAIVRSIIDLGHRLGFGVTCEGVEDAEALALLADAGCDQAQGYHIARPMPAAQLPGFVAGYPRPPHLR